jgi:purine-nucleoside phosphorylase
LSLLTVSDHLVTHAKMSVQQRQQGLDAMIEVLLAAVIA